MKGFVILGKPRDAEIIATGRGIDVLADLRETYGPENWPKMKGTADVLLANGVRRRAEVHWYEAHGIGVKRPKIKRYLD